MVHLHALHMQPGLTTDALSLKPCSVRLKSKAKDELRTLSFDDMMRLKRVSTVNLTQGLMSPTATPSIIELTYDSEGLLTSVDYVGRGKTVYMYKDQVLGGLQTFYVKDGVMTPKIVASASIDPGNKTITFTASKGVDGTHEEAKTSVYTYDDEERMISHKDFGYGAAYKTHWAYAKGAQEGTTSVESHGHPRSLYAFRHTLKGPVLMRSITFEQDPTEGVKKPSMDRVFSYKNGQLSSAKTTKFGTAEQLDTITYNYICK